MPIWILWISCNEVIGILKIEDFKFSLSKKLPAQEVDNSIKKIGQKLVEILLQIIYKMVWKF